jgi:hypothetical protein
VLSLLLCMASITLDVHTHTNSGYWRIFSTGLRHDWRVFSVRGTLLVKWQYIYRRDSGRWGAPPGTLYSTDYSGVRDTYLGFGINVAPRNGRWAPQGAAVAVPWWSLVGLFALLPGVRAGRWWWHRRHPTTPHRCISCSYDLTGNVSGVCPECGTTVAPSPDQLPTPNRLPTFPPPPRRPMMGRVL